MVLYRDILWLGWPLFMGLGLTLVAFLRLADALSRAGGANPPVVSRALTFFEGGDALRALVLLEGETHPVGVVLSGFWKAIPNPRQWEGTALIGEYQRLRATLLAPYARRHTALSQLVWGTCFFQIGWLAGQRPDLFQLPVRELLLTGPAAGILWVLLAFFIVGLMGLARQGARLKILGAQADQVIYQSISALSQGKAAPTAVGPRTIPPAPTGATPPPPGTNFVSKAYKG
ncbi:MAG TPA: hypothetical protein VEI97_08500 [bacterium]|nr:hypothetical protein [bacterium]